MPYIKQTIKNSLGDRFVNSPDNPGELNYILTVIVRDYFRTHGANYRAANDIIGALEGAKLEFYRRVVAPYEDTKIKENGDVY